MVFAWFVWFVVNKRCLTFSSKQSVPTLRRKFAVAGPEPFCCSSGSFSPHDCPQQWPERFKISRKFSLGHGHVADTGGRPPRKRVDEFHGARRRELPPRVRPLLSLPRSIACMTSLGVNAYRFGLEWSRLQSTPFAPLNQNGAGALPGCAGPSEGGGHHADGGAASFLQSAVDHGGGRLD